MVAVSPIIGGKTVKGPAAKMYAELGIEPSALAVAEHYRNLLTGFVLDSQDKQLSDKFKKSKILVTDTSDEFTCRPRPTGNGCAPIRWEFINMTLWAIVPVKPLRRGKSRLAGTLTEDERTALNQNLLERTIKVLSELKELDQSFGGQP